MFFFKAALVKSYYPDTCDTKVKHIVTSYLKNVNSDMVIKLYRPVKNALASIYSTV